MFKTRKMRLVSGLIVIAALVAAYVLLNRPESDARWQATNDAYLNADIVYLSPQVTGRLTEVDLQENAPVKAGQVIGRIDDRDYRLAVQSAEAAQSSAQASVASLQAQAKQQQATIDEAQAQLDADQAALALARKDAERYGNLAKDGSGSQQAHDQAVTQVQTDTATIAKGQAGLVAAREQLVILGAQLKGAAAAVERADAALGTAKLNLERTVIRAPFDGVIGVQRMRLGALVGPQSTLCAVVPVKAIYIDANYRETQLDHIAIGQPVRFTVDALPGRAFTGHVASIAPATGASYSQVPAHNATGNFTKIVQRLLVRIAIDGDQPGRADLRVGMSAETRIDTVGGGH